MSEGTQTVNRNTVLFNQVLGRVIELEIVVRSSDVEG